AIANSQVKSSAIPTPLTAKPLKWGYPRCFWMKDGVILLNTARGKLINEVDVAVALNRGKISAAGLDVVSQEPIRADNPLLTAKNCLLTPHIAWAPQETRQRLLDITVSNLTAFLAGRSQNVVAG
ncbi:MAG: NAD(P)-dependent oxidoreductase, partial [Schleiferilactobacillus perolens]|uniref:NAD(P)-dependent oxidoreductase n=1 Tax=Schleiferilactobacillus perolens TaxID=100468 RepID=UPI0039EAC7E9